jgi:hypothetical protein
LGWRTAHGFRHGGVIQQCSGLRTLEDGRKVKFTYQELPYEAAFITAQIAGNKVVYSIVLSEASRSLSHEDVEGQFGAELSKK